MAPDIEISASEAESVRKYAKRSVEFGVGVVLEKKYTSAGSLLEFRVKDEELKLYQVWHFDDEISDHLEASVDSISDLRAQGILKESEEKIAQTRRERDAEYFE